MSVTAFPTVQPGGVILDLDNLALEDSDCGIKLLSLDEAVSLCNSLKRSIIEATLALDPASNIVRYADRMFV